MGVAQASTFDLYSVGGGVHAPSRPPTAGAEEAMMSSSGEFVWQQAGATIIVSKEAPHPLEHRPQLSEAEIARVLARKGEVREQLIAEVMTRDDPMVRSGGRMIAAIIADTECAPASTNRRQLQEIGVYAPSRHALPIESAQVHQALWTVTYGLARLGIFLTGTDHLDDASLLKRLCTTVLEEEIQDIPPSTDMSEFVDLGGGAFPTPLDEACSHDEFEFDAAHCNSTSDASALESACLSVRPQEAEGAHAASHDPTAPYCANRDVLLPRPARKDGAGLM